MELEQLREELDDYLEAINENTTEIQSNYGLIVDMTNKIERLMERVEALEWTLKSRSERRFEPVRNLSLKEKLVFRAVYELGVITPFVSYREVAKRTKLPVSAIASMVGSLAEKGVPLLKRYEGNVVYVKVEELFRQEQARRNLVGLDAPLSCWLR